MYWTNILFITIIRAYKILSKSKGPHTRQRLSTATTICSQIVVAVGGLPTHATTDLFNLSQLNRNCIFRKILTSPTKFEKILNDNNNPNQYMRLGCWSGCGW